MTASRRSSVRPTPRPATRPRSAAAGVRAGVQDSAAPPERAIPPRERARLARGLDRMQEAARRSRGRPLRPGDDLFPELEGMGDAEVTEAVAHALEREGVDPALVYAFRKTGLLISAETLPLLSAAGRRAWEVAVREFGDRQD